MGKCDVFGRELAFGGCNIRGKIYYLLFGHDFVGLRVRAMHVRKMLKGIEEPGAILDAGCGDGCYSFYLARRFPKAKVHAIDEAAELIERCEEIRSRLNIANLRFMAKSLIALSTREAYDLILCIDVLEHILEDEIVLNNLREALSGKGTLLVHVPQRRQLNRFVLGPLGDGYVHEHVRDEYTEQEIEKKIESAGLRVEAKRYTFGWAGSLARELYYLFEGCSGLRKMFYRTMVFPVSIALGVLDTLMPNRTHQGFLYKLSKPASVVEGKRPAQRWTE